MPREAGRLATWRLCGMALAVATSLAWPERVMAQGAEQQVTQRLVQEFGVEERRIADLRKSHLGYGEIHHVLSLATQMPGGITDENVNEIMAMRQERKMGWGAIAHELGTPPHGHNR
ncbi:MAG: hypothetical protein Q8R91_10965 [Candidatus Omnitrophota bacterium]|nr:hypothetical protein [Candidatus Omnitrophota bacterium]